MTPCSPSPLVSWGKLKKFSEKRNQINLWNSQTKSLLSFSHKNHKNVADTEIKKKQWQKENCGKWYNNQMKTNGKNVKRYLKCLPNAVRQWSKNREHTHEPKVNENILN